MSGLSLADKLGIVQARIADLRKVEQELKNEIIEIGEPVDGNLFRANPVFSERAVTNWQKVAIACSPSHQLISAHTRVVSSTAVTVTAKRRDAA